MKCNQSCLGFELMLLCPFPTMITITLWAPPSHRWSNSSISSNSIYHKSFVCTLSNSSIWSIDRTLSGAATLGHSEPGNVGNIGVLCIPQSPSITEASPSDGLMSYSDHLLGGGLTPLQRCSWCILQPQLTGIRIFLVFSTYQFETICKSPTRYSSYYFVYCSLFNYLICLWGLEYIDCIPYSGVRSSHFSKKLSLVLH